MDLEGEEQGGLSDSAGGAPAASLAGTELCSTEDEDGAMGGAAANAEGEGGGGAQQSRPLYPSLQRSDALPLPASGVGGMRGGRGSARGLYTVQVSAPPVTRKTSQDATGSRAQATYSLVNYRDKKSCWRARDIAITWRALHSLGAVTVSPSHQRHYGNCIGQCFFFTGPEHTQTHSRPDHLMIR